jgi:mRNA interferase RelE/StbE
VYRIEVSPATDRDFAKLKQRILRNDFEHLRDAVRNLAVQPRLKGVRKIRGAEMAYRIRVGSCRIIFEIYDNENLVLILRVVRWSEATYRT